MGFILDGLGTEPYDREYSDRELVRRILGYFRPYARRMALVAGMILANSLVGTAGPILISRGLDNLSVDASLRTMLVLAGGLLALGVSGWCFSYIHRWFSARVVGNVVLDLRRDVFDATIRHDLSFFDEQASGKIVNRVTSDTQGFSQAVTLTMDCLAR